MRLGSNTMSRELKRSTASSYVVMVCTLLSRVLGFVRIATITWVFGAGSKADIINLTFSIPNNLRKLLAEGALSSAFVPELSRTIVEDETLVSSNRLVRNILAFQLLIIVPLCVASILAARPLIVYVLSEFESQALVTDSVRLFRLFINYLLLISVSAVLMGVLNAHRKFFVPAFAPILFSVSVISSILLFARGLGIYAVAVGVLIGGLLQLGFLLPTFRRVGYSFKFSFDFKNSHFRRVLVMWGPVLATSSLFAVTNQIAIRFASGMGEGSVTSLSIALTFFQLPFGVFSASITTVLFPRISRQVAQSDTEGVRDSIQYGIRFIAVLLVPSTIFLILGGEGLVAVAFQRGEFTYERTIITAQVLTAYASGLFFVGGFTFLQRLFYALGKERIPFYVGLAVASVDIALMIVLKEGRLATAGIALANSISFGLGFVSLLIVAARSIGTLDLRRIVATIVKTFIAIIPAVGAVVGFREIIGRWWVEGSSALSFAMLILELLIFCSVILLVYRLIRVEMLTIIADRRRNQ